MAAETGLYPVEMMARVVNVSPRRVQQLAKTGIIPPAQQGRYALAESVNGYVRYLQAQAQAQRRAPDELGQQRESLLRERHRRLKLENDQREAASIPLEEAQVVCEMAIEAFDDSMKALYSRTLLNELAAMDEPAVVRHRLKEAVRACRQDAADRLGKLAERQAP